MVITDSYENVNLFGSGYAGLGISFEEAGDISTATSSVRKVNMGKEREIRRCKMQLEGIS